MPTLPLYNIEGTQTGEVDVPAELFDLEPNEAVLHQVVVAELAARRQGTAHTKTRAAVAGSTRKLWRQKGIGRARVGDRRPPHWTGGGVALGPQARSHRTRLPRRVKTRALCFALSAHARAGAISLLEPFELPEPKTRALQEVLDAVGLVGRGLLVIPKPDQIIWRCGRNIPGLAIRPATELTAYDVLSARSIVITRDAVAALEARLS
jgi:large subunit ribosomal protein L4